MDPQFFDLLPQSIQQLVLDIERVIGKPIAVRRRNSAQGISEGFARFVTVRCYLDNGETIVDISYPGETLELHSLIHEILHAWRYIVLGIPFLNAYIDDPYVKRTADSLENDLEHILVIPAEIEIAPEAETYWERFYCDSLREVELALAFKRHSNLGITHQQNVLMRMWLATGATPQLGFRTKLQSLLEQTDYLAKANSLIADINRVLPNKADMTAVLLSHLNLPTEPYCLEKFDVPGRTISSWAIPELALR